MDTLSSILWTNEQKIRVPVSAALDWVPCYDKFYCANLEVPLDYGNQSAGTTYVAFIRQNAANGTGQDLLFNPGGPGGSGINLILEGFGDQIIALGGGKYNAVSFDPRGVNNSGIALTCFPGHPELREAYWPTVTSPLIPDLSLRAAYSQAIAQGQFCTKANENTTAKYGGTSAVVQDLVQFTNLQAALDGVAEPNKTQIYYYGVSYGTVIGHTLAALYPDRVGRIIVDSNVNSEDYYNGVTINSVETTDDDLGWFFGLCAEAGPQKCPFATSNSSSSDLKARFDALLVDLVEAPPIVSDLQASIPQIITKKRVLSTVFQILYNPATEYPLLAYGLSSLVNKNVTGWLEIEAVVGAASDPGPFNYTSSAEGEVLDFVTGIDAAGRYPIQNVEQYIQVTKEIEAGDVYFGKEYAEQNVLINAGFKIHPPASQLFPDRHYEESTLTTLSGFQKINTSTPVLFVNNAADPITPLSGAKHMFQYFGNSALLVQNSPGHSFTSVKSECTLAYVAAYLANATLPSAGTVCEISTRPLVDGEVAAKRSVAHVARRSRRSY
ncbi:hypothetical protein N0V83_000806 [Neocucurbitaria cava]|uniref:Uncharacterized protein n=1 Tax=Neocucurbitaria cava TaxID=798079 RepID=A0A9W9CRJ1_9PLEO|nr:hypothetical protein N0V83_000806 [Neocucurbitaria cava]